MASAHPFSAPGVNSSLQLFEVPVTDVSIIKSKWVDYEPIQSGTNLIEFVIKPLSDYIDINKIELRLVVKITKRNGGETGAGKNFTLINNALHSIIKQFTIKINETLVTEQSDTQAYNAYIKTLLNFTDQAKKSYLTKALYYKDTAGHMDEVDNTADRNLGLKKRGSFTTGDAEVGMVGVPLCDVFNLDKLLLDGLEIKIKIDLNSTEVSLMGGEDANDCKLQIVSSTLRVRTVHVADSTKLDHVNTMTGKKALPAIYTLTRTPTHARIIPRGLLNHTETDLFNGLILQCIIFGMVRNDAYKGNLRRNPFNFQLFDLNAVRLTVNGEEMPYSGIDLIGGKKIDGYNTLFSGSGDMNCGHGIDIDRKEWEQGYGLFRLDTTPAGSGHPDHLIPNRSGNVNLYLKFGTETPAVLNLIMYAEFQNQLEIDRNRRVVYDLSQGA